MNRLIFYMPMQFSLQIAGADMAVSMLHLLLQLLTTATQAAVTVIDSTMTTDQQLQTVLCL